MAIMMIVSTPTVRTLAKKTRSNLDSRIDALAHTLGEPRPDTAGMTAYDLAKLILGMMRRLPEDNG